MSDLLANIHDAAGISEDITSRLTALESGEAALAGIEIDQTLDIPIVGGQGSLTTPKKTTFWVTITGSGTVIAPAHGTWNIQVVDLVAGKTVFEGTGIAVNQKINFSYKTGFSTQLKASAQWSNSGDTTLQVHIVAST
jgi:hypothetical protein